MDYSKMRVLVVGMARSGIAAAQLLYKLGTKEIILNDMRDREAFSGKSGRPLGTGHDGPPWHGARFPHPWGGPHRVQQRRALLAGVDQKRPRGGNSRVNELELAYRVTKADFVAITGTNGKTTTTTLVSEIFRAAGKVSHPVGNIGDPACTYAYELQEGDVAVAEVAPFQLVSTLKFHPRVSAILNITEDHLDWFQTMENYIRGKCIVFQNQTPADHCVLNYDNEITRGLLR